MRTRTTWQHDTAAQTRQAATVRTADPYSMNQKHEQPSPVEYANGSPDTWAETPVAGDKMNVNDEYENGHVKRNEIGMGEMRDDTFKHKDSDVWGGSGKYDNARVSTERKAQAAERLARAVLRNANDEVITDTACGFMTLPSAILASTLKKMDAASPAALPEQSRLRRALACTRLAARTLGKLAAEADVEKLARLYSKVDDTTLKSMITCCASVKVAQEQAEQMQGGEQVPPAKTSQEQQQAQQEQQQTAQQQQEQQAQQQCNGQEEQQANCLPPEELAKLDQLIQEEMAECAPAADAAAGDDIAAIFGNPMPAAPMPAVASDVAGGQNFAAGISFDDDDQTTRTAGEEVSIAQLAAIFADNPEVQAQRQIVSASNDQRARASAGNFAPVGRVASAGAKKLGQVISAPVAPKATLDDVLESLWDRPGR